MHQFANGRALRRKREVADVHRLFVHVPTVRPEDSADRVASQHFGVFLLVAIVKLVGESDDSVGAADGCIVLQAVQAGTSQPRFTGENLDAIAAESMFDTFAVEQYRLCRTSAEHCGEDGRWESPEMHTCDWRQKVDEPYTVRIRA